MWQLQNGTIKLIGTEIYYSNRQIETGFETIFIILTGTKYFDINT